MKGRLVEHRKLVAAVGLVIGLINVAAIVFVPAESGRDQLSWMFAIVPMFFVGALLIIRVPASLVGWLLLTVAVAGSFGTYQGLEGLDGWAAAAGAGLSTFGIALLPGLLLVFPDGALPSRRWRPAVSLVASAVLLGGVNGLLTGGWGGDVEEAITLSPLYESTRSFTEVTGNFFFPLYTLSFLAALASLLVRYRSGSAEVRHQLKWLLSGVGFMALALLLVMVTVGATSGNEGWLAILLAVGIGSVPIAIGIAILRYRLYDIDIVISKSVTYLGLAAAITLLYAAVVVGPLLIIGSPDEGGPGLALPLAATALVAVLFEPIRLRMQRWANRVVYGKRSTPHEVLSRVTARLSEATAENSTTDLARLLAEGTGADQAVVWLRSGETMRPEGVWSADQSAQIAPVLVLELAEDEFTATTPVLHGEKVLGALSITKPRNEPVTPADTQLLSDVAAGAGLLLRNISLNHDLVERAREVRASRQRLIAAQDAERHRLERDLHDGAQQQVVALKVKLGIAKTIANREGADEVASHITALADETQQAVDALRAVAHGIYPPLLESEGLETALRAVERSSAIPLAIDASGLVRYARPVEETMYFCVLEILEKARRSGAKSAQLGLAERDSDLIIEVDVEGGATALDLIAVSDRLDAVEGTLTIRPMRDGTQILATMPPHIMELA